MEEIVIVGAARSAIGKFGGTLAKTPASELGATVIQALLQRAKLEGGQIGEVILGQVLAAGVGQNPARQAVIKSGLPHSVPAFTINKVCGSGLKAVMLRPRPSATATARSSSPAGRRTCPPARMCCWAAATDSAWATGRWSIP